MATIDSHALKEMLFAGVNPASFKPYVDYSPEADAVNVYFRPDPDYSERLSEHVTLFRSVKDRSLVGCRIKGVSGIVQDAHNWLKVDHDGIQLSIIFWSFRGGVDEEKHAALQELIEKAGDLRLQPCH